MPQYVDENTYYNAELLTLRATLDYRAISHLALSIDSHFRLLNPDGSLVSFAGGTEKEAKVISAVASNVWFAYERHGKPAAAGAPAVDVDGGEGSGGKEGLRNLVLECEVNDIAIRNERYSADNANCSIG